MRKKDAAPSRPAVPTQKGHPCGRPLCVSSFCSLAAGGAGRAPGGARLHARLDVEAHVGVEFHGDGLSFAHQVGFNQKSVSVDFVNYVVVFLLIQSKRQARPASASRHVHPDRGYVLARKMHIKLLFGSLGEFKHGNPPLCGECGSY